MQEQSKVIEKLGGNCTRGEREEVPEPSHSSIRKVSCNDYSSYRGPEHTEVSVDAL